MTSLPVFAMERETGDVYVHEIRSNLDLMVEEFWDILDDEFIFFEATGQRLTFVRAFGPLADPDVHAPSPEERQLLLAALERYARTNGLPWDAGQPLQSLALQLRAAQMHRDTAR